ncbi:MAG: O-antigen ligase family protein [Elusimicrobia bacterium]|nr:O-antigen ligase family protein [Elusimicrobiota bacterium]
MISSDSGEFRSPWLPAGLALAAVLVPLAWSTHFVAEYTLPKFLVLQLGVLLAAAGLAAAPAAAWRTPLARPILINLLVLAVAALASQDWRLSLLGRYNSYSHGLWTCALYAILGLAASFLDRAQSRRLGAVLLAAAALVAAYAVLQVSPLPDPFLRGALPQGRAVSSLGSPVDLGAFLAMALPLAAYWAAAESRWLGGLAGAVIVAGLWATVSRGAWGAAAIGLASFAALALAPWEPGRGREALRRTPRWAWALGAALVLLAGVAAVRRVSGRVAGGNDSSRVEVWRSAWRIFTSEPVFGTGPDTFEQAFRRQRTEEFVRRMRGSVRLQAYAHNDVLQALATTGLLGTAAYLYLLWAVAAIAWRAVRQPRERLLASGLSGGLIACFINVKVNPVALEVMAQTALFAGLLAALTRPEPSGPGERAPQGFARGLAALAVLAGAAGLALTARWSFADMEAKHGATELKRGLTVAGADHLRTALTLNRCENSYRVSLMNVFGDLINADKSVPARVALLEESMAVARAAVACHPEDVNAHYALGIASWMHVQLGLDQHLALAEAELDAALERDPLFLPLLEHRLAVARRRGPEAAKPWAERLARARSVAPY